MNILSRLPLFYICMIVVFLLQSCDNTRKNGEFLMMRRTSKTIEREISQLPPNGLSVKEVPQFVVFGFDDNALSGHIDAPSSGGLTYLLELFDSVLNPDGTPCHFSFYVNGEYIADSSGVEAVYNKITWKNAILQGHEIGNHTFSHPHGFSLSKKEWLDEISKNNCVLEQFFKTHKLDMDTTMIYGFRTPYLEYNKATFDALQSSGILYDCSIEEGFQENIDGTNHYWPYTLHNGRKYAHNDPDWLLKNKVFEKSFPRLWELPCYALIAIPDSACSTYGIEEGFCKRLHERVSYFNPEKPKISGLDWNLFVEFNMSKEEALAILQYNFDIRFYNNRSPFTIGAHSDMYADQYNGEYLDDDESVRTSAKERRWVLKQFIQYVLQKDATRIVNAKELLDWLQTPKKI